MVIKIYALSILLFCNFSQANEFDANKLRNLFKASKENKQTVSERLKASSSDTSNLRLLKDTDLQYKLPNGVFTNGIVLSNGKLAPALYIENKLSPACVTTDYTLVQGSWNEKGQVIECNIPQQKLAVIDGEQISTVKPEKIEKKYSSNKYQKKNESQKNNSKPKVDRNIYTPPKRSSSKQKSIGAVLGGDTKKYGISIGTWAGCRLERPVSSAESGFIEFTLTDALIGRYKTIPAGTKLFASKGINAVDKRLEARISKALTPDEDEIDNISATVYDMSKRGGLGGELVRDIEGESNAAAGKALLSGLSVAVPVVGGSQVAGAMVGRYADDALSNEKRYLDNSPQATIRVSPQPCLIKIAESF
jgi:hypothetical protein